jgi:hypothetical protein
VNDTKQRCFCCKRMHILQVAAVQRAKLRLSKVKCGKHKNAIHCVCIEILLGVPDEEIWAAGVVRTGLAFLWGNEGMLMKRTGGRRRPYTIREHPVR